VITTLAASSGLRFGENNNAVGTSLLRHLPHQIVGRRSLFDDYNFISDTSAGQRGAQFFASQRITLQHA
jgi:hypothetical protein